jgi:hypothetical protein
VPSLLQTFMGREVAPAPLAPSLKQPETPRRTLSLVGPRLIIRALHTVTTLSEHLLLRLCDWEGESSNAESASTAVAH